jgi:hypothetical protein
VATSRQLRHRDSEPMRSVFFAKLIQPVNKVVPGG